MPRLLLACVCLLAVGTATVQAQPPRRPPATVTKIVDKAVMDVRKNRKPYDEANKKVLAEAEKDLNDELDRLTKSGKLDEAVAAREVIKSLKDTVMDRADAPLPQEGRALVPQRPLLERLEGKWGRDHFHEDYVFLATGAVEARNKADGKVLYTGRCRALSDDSGEVELQSGYRWVFRVVGDQWIAIRETSISNGEASNDGIVLTRIK